MAQAVSSSSTTTPAATPTRFGTGPVPPLVIDLQAEPELRLPARPDLKPHAPCVVFGMPSSEYHADPSSGSTDLKRLICDHTTYWWHSWMNPERPADTDTVAKQKGHAIHKLVLEGEAAFDRHFTVEPQPADWPGCLITADDLKAFLKERGDKVSGVKAELAKLVRKHDPEAIIWDELMATFKAMAERDGKQILKADVLAEVKRAAGTVALNPHLLRAFKGGAPEVSVFWVEDGMPLKARFDLLKPKAIVDLKKFQNARQRPIDVAIKLAIAEYRYDVQAKHYLTGYAELYTAAQEGRVFGQCPLPKGWESQIAEPEDILFTWVFQQTDGPPVTVGRQIGPQSPALNKATRELAQAKAKWRDCMARFGSDMWISDEPIRELSDTDLPAWMREGVEA